MELGFDGVLLNSSVARSFDPIQMAKAMNLAVKSGRLSYLIRIDWENKKAVRSTPFRGKISNF